MAKPAGPTVSWPTTPCAIVVASSLPRWAMPPPRMLVMTKSAPVMHGSGVACACTGMPGAMRPARVGDEGEPRLVDVVEVDAIDGERRAGESAGEQRHAHAGAADDGELHDGLLEERADRGRERFAAATAFRGRAACVLGEAPPAASRGAAARRVRRRARGRGRAHGVAGGQAHRRRAAAQPRGEKAGAEGVAGAGRVHGRDPRRRHHHVALGAVSQPAAAQRSQLHDHRALALAQRRIRVVERVDLRVERRLELVDEDEVERVHQRRQLGPQRQRFAPPEVPRHGGRPGVSAA